MHKEKGSNYPWRKTPAGTRGRVGQRERAEGWDPHMHNSPSVERTISLPFDAPVKLVEDIQAYSALIELQSKMSGASAWYAKLS